eukprot:691312-Lingulodinium_polyedra.AAC.1
MAYLRQRATHPRECQGEGHRQVPVVQGDSGEELLLVCRVVEPHGEKPQQAQGDPMEVLEED